MDEPPYRLKPHLDRDLRHAAVPRWRVQPSGDSNSRRTRQRLDSFRALAQAGLALASSANESPACRTSRNTILFYKMKRLGITPPSDNSQD